MSKTKPSNFTPASPGLLSWGKTFTRSAVPAGAQRSSRLSMSLSVLSLLNHLELAFPILSLEFALPLPNYPIPVLKYRLQHFSFWLLKTSQHPHFFFVLFVLFWFLVQPLILYIWNSNATVYLFCMKFVTAFPTISHGINLKCRKWVPLPSFPLPLLCFGFNNSRKPWTMLWLLYLWSCNFFYFKNLYHIFCLVHSFVHSKNYCQFQQLV